MIVAVRMAARMMLKIALVCVVATEAPNGFPEGFQMLEHFSRAPSFRPIGSDYVGLRTKAALLCRPDADS